MRWAEAGGAWRGEVAATLRLAWPLIVAQLASIALTTTDVLMLGRIGPEAVAASGLAIGLNHPFMMFGFGVALAASPLMSQARGARRPRALRRAARQGLWASAGLAAAMIVPLGFYAEPILRAMGQPPALAEGAAVYLSAAVWMLPGAIGFVVLRGFAATHDETASVLAVALMGIAVNALANYALIFGNFGLPRLELFGAGIATALTHSAMFAALAIWIATSRRYRRYALFARLYRADWETFRALFRLGGPIGLMLLAESGLFAGAIVLMGWIGTAEAAAHVVALQLAAIAFMVPLGLSHATTIRVGYFWGARDDAGWRRAGWVSIGLCSVFMLMTAALFWRAPETLARLFLDPAAPGADAAIALAVAFIGVAAIFQLGDGAQVAAATALRGTSDTTAPMWIALAGYWLVGLPAAAVLAFPLGLGGIGVWWGLAIGLSFCAIVLIARFIRRRSPWL